MTDDLTKRLAAALDSLQGIEQIRAAAQDLPVYLVGGAVRDLLLGQRRTDVDIVVEGDAAAVAARLGGESVAHERFGTATVQAGELAADLAAARSESYARPGALPNVRPASLVDDLARRDFTLNAMAIPLQGETTLIDPHSGREDLRRGLVRVLHERSFADDPTRALRAARYAARFDFALDPETERLAREADFGTVSEDRREAELRKLASEPNARRGFELLDEWGLLSLEDERGELIDLVVELLSQPQWSEISSQAPAVLATVRGEVGRAPRLASRAPSRPSEGVELARGASGGELAIARILGGSWLDDYVERWRHVGLEITGQDLIVAGVSEGPAVGRGLAAALARKLDGEVEGREQELATALEAARGDSTA